MHTEKLYDEDSAYTKCSSVAAGSRVVILHIATLD